jgi:hypothetical protein
LHALFPEGVYWTPRFEQPGEDEVMKKTLVAAVVVAAVGMIGMGQTASSEEHVAVLGEKLDSGLGTMVYGESLDSGLGTIKPEDWKKYVK